MRFISQYPNYKVQVRPQKVRSFGDGTVNVVQEGLYTAFTAVDQGGMVYERERQIARDHFHFHGSQQEQDEATPVDPIHRLSVFDTEESAKVNGWSPEEVALVEQTLLEKTQTTPNAVIVIEGTPVPAPFPAYDDWQGDAEELVLKLTGDGFDLSQVLLYEQNFGKRRPDVIEALQIAVEALKELTVHG